MTLSVQELNLVSIYHSETRMDTIHQLREALPYMDAEVLSLAKPLIGKLEHISDSRFAALFPEGVSR